MRIAAALGRELLRSEDLGLLGGAFWTSVKGLLRLPVASAPPQVGM